MMAQALWNTEQSLYGCNWLEKYKKMQVRRPWHSGMLTGTWMDAHGRKEIKKSAIAFRNAHRDMDGCTCLEINKKKEVRRQWDSGMLTGTWMDAPGRKEIK